MFRLFAIVVVILNLGWTQQVVAAGTSYANCPDVVGGRTITYPFLGPRLLSSTLANDCHWGQSTAARTAWPSSVLSNERAFYLAGNMTLSCHGCSSPSMEGDIRIFFHPSLQNVRLNGVAPSGTLINRTTPQAYVVTFTEIVGGVPYHFKGTIGPFNNGTFRLRSRDETTTTPGVTVTETGGATQVSESGNTDTFSVVLDSEPTGDVVIDVTSSDVGEGTVSLNQLTFTTANWNVPQTVTVTGSDDGVIDGDQTFNIALNINTGLTADTYYHASDPADVTATTTDINAIISRTQSVVAEHLAAKGQLILSQNPRLTNRLQQRQPTNANQSNLTSHIELDAVEKPADFQANFSMDGDTTRSLVTLDTSANRLMSYAGAGSGHGLSTSPTDVWVKVRWAKDKTNSRSTDSLLAYVGVDHQISANTLVGFIGQIDTFDTKDQTQSFNASSKGWMLGPYIASEVSENLYLDARVSWGKASNKVSPFNTYTDEFDSTRLMASASLTGSMQGKGHFDGYQIEPELEVSHFQETQEAYVDTNSVTISETQIKMTNVSAGPTLVKTLVLDDKTKVSLRAGARAVWSDVTSSVTIPSAGFSNLNADGFRGRLEFGVTWDWNMGNKEGSSLELDTFLDGLGKNNSRTHGASLKYRMPF